MDNKRCEITVALYGDTSDSSTVPDAITLAPPQYFVEAYALRDAHDERSEWHYPVILRFEECDILVERVALGVIARKYPGDARKFIGDAYANEEDGRKSPYFSRVAIAGMCAGESPVLIATNNERGTLTLFLETHCIRIS